MSPATASAAPKTRGSEDGAAFPADAAVGLRGSLFYAMRDWKLPRDRLRAALQQKCFGGLPKD